MSTKWTEKSCSSFVTTLASNSPTPGGGGAASLVGSIGVALGNMVGSLTVGKKKYASVEKEILALKAKADTMQKQLLDLVERDAEVFAPLVQAYSLPAETEAQRTMKETIMEQSLRKAALVPLQVMQISLAALDIIGRFARIGSRMAVSDAGCAAACMQAALKSAALNVLINTKSMKNRIYAEEINSRVNFLLCKGSAYADDIFEYVRTQLNQEE